MVWRVPGWAVIAAAVPAGLALSALVMPRWLSLAWGAALTGEQPAVRAELLWLAVFAVCQVPRVLLHEGAHALMMRHYGARAIRWELWSGTPNVSTAAVFAPRQFVVIALAPLAVLALPLGLWLIGMPQYLALAFVVLHCLTMVGDFASAIFVARLPADTQITDTGKSLAVVLA